MAGATPEDGGVDTPEITVELNDRRSVDRAAPVAGLLAGAAVAAVAGLGAVGAVGFPVQLDATTAWVVLGFNCAYALAFGSLFGLLVDSRPAWRYGRGFLGPVVGAGFGLALFLGLNVLFWPAWLLVVGLTLPPAAPLVVALGSYLAYGALLGVFLNGWGLLRA